MDPAPRSYPYQHTIQRLGLLVEAFETVIAKNVDESLHKFAMKRGSSRGLEQGIFFLENISSCICNKLVFLQQGRCWISTYGRRLWGFPGLISNCLLTPKVSVFWTPTTKPPSTHFTLVDDCGDRWSMCLRGDMKTEPPLLLLSTCNRFSRHVAFPATLGFLAKDPHLVPLPL